MIQGAVLCRVAPSFIRFGSFHFHSALQCADLAYVIQLVDYTIIMLPQCESWPFERQAMNEIPFSAVNVNKEHYRPQTDISNNRYASTYLLTNLSFHSYYWDVYPRCALPKYLCPPSLIYTFSIVLLYLPVRQSEKHWYALDTTAECRVALPS